MAVKCDKKSNGFVTLSKIFIREHLCSFCNTFCSRTFLLPMSHFLFHKHFLLLLSYFLLFMSHFLFANVLCYFCNVFYTCFHDNKNNNKASFRTFEHSSRSKKDKEVIMNGITLFPKYNVNVCDRA